MARATQEIALGFRVRTGYASAVALSGPASSPRVLLHGEVELHDPAQPESRFPFHAALELQGRQASTALERATRIARAAAASSMKEFLARLEAAPRAAAIVVASATDPDSIANPHMRAHAAEGQLFPELIEEGLSAARISKRRIVERELDAQATRVLDQTPAQWKRELARMGKEAGKPWRALEKSAALAAWILLSERD